MLFDPPPPLIAVLLPQYLIGLVCTWVSMLWSLKPFTAEWLHHFNLKDHSNVVTLRHIGEETGPIIHHLAPFLLGC